jgi:hypothetical protein
MSQGPANPAANPLATLYRLTLEGLASTDLKELSYRALNRSVELAPFHRATLWDATRKPPRFLGVSGRVDADTYSPLREAWQRLTAALPEPGAARVLSARDFPGLSEQWATLDKASSGLSVAHVPLPGRDRVLAFLWLERWSGAPWQEEEVRLLESLGAGYGAVWDKLLRRRDLPERLALFFKRRAALFGVLALVLAVALLWRMPLRVVAPCEIVPLDPTVVTAPLNGVVAEISVAPGQVVKAGDTLFVYDKRVALEDLKVARQQVQIIQQSLTRAKMQAFGSEEARADVALLELKLDQERIKLQLSESNFSKLEVRAERPGAVVINDPFEWRGKPVRIGEQVLMLVDPASTKLRVWLAEDDHIAFDPKVPVKVLLNAFPEDTQRAVLNYVAQGVSVSPKGAPSVMAEAAWITPDPALKAGLQGVAVTYGEEVSLAYWLLRKPWAALRRLVGI